MLSAFRLRFAITLGRDYNGWLSCLFWLVAARGRFTPKTEAGRNPNERRLER